MDVAHVLAFVCYDKCAVNAMLHPPVVFVFSAGHL